ncbi:hypothetical protein TNIN_481621 [Trichonephila inaurata madagascariensis]|uniref:Uncharacterized protein n=1 Tax=Trichonephila inaurata madagascariensis TaxID=2747483 RepID=A0A8X6WRF4_9ARAC|nr:hypothetical protein TNIN_129181 [Trichonephila inaurata madagascariensis]GFY39973.1 hypothetical protein TNIN_481621 [Trichonephila inaurata madagascariensis]
MLEEFNKCWRLTPTEAKEMAWDVYAEFFPGEYNLDRLDPFKLETCNTTDIEKMFEIYSKIHEKLWKYMKETQVNPLRSNEQMQCHKAKACASPLMAKCIEFGNKCG